jgi:hypothetical protein
MTYNAEVSHGLVPSGSDFNLNCSAQQTEITARVDSSIANGARSVPQVHHSKTVSSSYGNPDASVTQSSQILSERTCNLKKEITKLDDEIVQL